VFNPKDRSDNAIEETANLNFDYIKKTILLINNNKDRDNDRKRTTFADKIINKRKILKK